MIPRAWSAPSLITGGTGGLGRAVVGAFVANDWDVVVLDARPAELEGARVVQADLTDPGAVARRVAATEERAAAARARQPRRRLRGRPARRDDAGGRLRGAVPLNLRPTYLVTQAALPALVAAGGGAIVCVSSRSALHPFAGAAGYCASKAAVIAFAQVVAREHADDGVRCNAVLPSMIDTPANRAVDAARAARRAHAAGRDRRGDPLPLQRRVGADDRRRDPRLRRSLSRRRSGSRARRARACGARCRPR